MTCYTHIHIHILLLLYQGRGKVVLVGQAIQVPNNQVNDKSTYVVTQNEMNPVIGLVHIYSCIIYKNYKNLFKHAITMQVQV